MGVIFRNSYFHSEPFKTKFFLNERVNEVNQDKENWIIKTNKNNQFSAPNLIIAGGVGSFEPRKLSLKDAEKFESTSVFYSCLLYTSPSPRDQRGWGMPASA